MSTVRNPKLLRKSNVSAILWQLYNSGGMSRLDLARNCELTTASVTQLVRQLIEDGYVCETGSVQRNNTGRREVILDIVYKNFLAIGVNVEGDNTHLSVCSLTDVLSETVYKTAELISGDNERFFFEIAALLAKYGARVKGICVGVVGKVDEDVGVLKNSYGIFEKNYNLKSELEARFNVPVTVKNNVVAQAKSLITDECRDFVFVKHSPGIGCAIVDGGKVTRGRNGGAGELGHTLCEEDGLPCRCGKRGCLETVVSERAIEEKYRVLSGEARAVSAIYAAYKTDENARAVLDNCISKLSLAIGNLTELFAPKEVLVTGGIFFQAELLEAIKDKMKSYGFEADLILVDNSQRIKALAEANCALRKAMFEV